MFCVAGTNYEPRIREVRSAASGAVRGGADEVTECRYRGEAVRPRSDRGSGFDEKSASTVYTVHSTPLCRTARRVGFFSSVAKERRHSSGLMMRQEGDGICIMNGGGGRVVVGCVRSFSFFA
jgi:hypothetical protein